MRWIVKDNILSPELQSGNVIVPSAEHIFLAKFRDYGNSNLSSWV